MRLQKMATRSLTTSTTSSETPSGGVLPTISTLPSVAPVATPDVARTTSVGDPPPTCPILGNSLTAIRPTLSDQTMLTLGNPPTAGEIHHAPEMAATSIQQLLQLHDAIQQQLACEPQEQQAFSPLANQLADGSQQDGTTNHCSPQRATSDGDNSDSDGANEMDQESNQVKLTIIMQFDD
jgi:hypothetical protein